ncbi:MAG: hypothetical protein IV100_21765 [Myxococcales bacterium]|nr:hypothetical protein [Myxococcales bacterium]
MPAADDSKPQPVARPGWLAVALPHLVTAVVVTGLHLPALLGGVYFLDVYATEVHPHLVEVQRALDHGQLPWWSPGLQLGYPLAANPQVGALYPLHLALLPWMDVHQMLALSVWLHGVVGACGMVALVRRYGGGGVGAAVAGVVYSCSPFVVFYHQAIHGVVALALLPWCVVVGAALGSPRFRKGAFAGLVVILTLGFYAGHLQLMLYGAVAAALAAVSEGLGAPGSTWRDHARTLLRLGGAGALSVLLYGPQLLPAIELWSLSLRRALSPDAMLAGLATESLGLDDAVESILPRFFGGPSLRDFWYPEFLGLPVLAAAAAAWRRRPRALGFLVLLPLVVLVAVQVPGLSRVLLGIPGLSVFRAPGRVYCLLLLGVSALAGLGVDRLWERPRWSLGLLGVALALGVSIALGLLDGVAFRDPELTTAPALLATALTNRAQDGVALALAAGLLLLSGVVPVRFRCVAVAAGVVWPVLYVGARYSPTVDLVEPPPVVAFLRSAPTDRVLGVTAGNPNYLATVPGPTGWQPGRLDSGATNPDPRTFGRPEHAMYGVGPDSNVAFGLHGIHVQTSLPLKRVVTRLFGDLGVLDYPLKQDPPWDASFLEHLGVTHVVTHRHGLMPVSPRPPAVWQRDNIVAHALQRPKGRVRFYPAALTRTVAPGDSTALARREGPAPDLPLLVEAPRSKGLLTSPDDVPLPANAPDLVREAELVRVGAGAIDARITASTDGIVLVVESAYPGWLLEVDGVRQDWVVADGAFIGVPVTAGAHRIALRFDPVRAREGLWLLGAGVVGLLTVLLWPRPAQPRPLGDGGLRSQIGSG